MQLAIKAVLVLGIVITLIIVVFPMIWNVTAEVYRFFTDKPLNPEVPDKVTIVATNPSKVMINAHDDNYWKGSNYEIDCYPCGNGCCLTVLFDRNMRASDFQGSNLYTNVKIWVEKSRFTDIGVPDERADWETDELEISEYSAELKNGNELTISGFENKGNLNYLIRFNPNLMSTEQKEDGSKMPLNTDKTRLTFEMS